MGVNPSAGVFVSLVSTSRWALLAILLAIPGSGRAEPEGEIELWLEDGHLVGRFPWSGTFGMYLQPDCSLHQEDSHQIFVPVRNEDGSLAGIVDQRMLEQPALEDHDGPEVEP